MLLNDGSTQCVPADSVSPEDIIFTVTMNSRASIVDVRDAYSFLSILRQDEVHEDYTVPFPITFVCVHCRGVESFFSLIGRDRDTGNGVDLRSARSFPRTYVFSEVRGNGSLNMTGLDTLMAHAHRSPMILL